MSLFHSLPIDLQQFIFIHFIGDREWDAWKTLGNFDIAHTNRSDRPHVIDILFPSLKMIWVYNPSIDDEALEYFPEESITTPDTTVTDDDVKVNMIYWIMKRNIPISKLYITWKIFFKIFEYSETITLFTNVEKLCIGSDEHNEIDTMSFASASVDCNIFQNLNQIKYVSIFNVYHENQVIFLTYLPQNSLEIFRLDEIVVSIPQIVESILTNQRYSLKQLTIPINQISTLKHLISYPLPRLCDINIKVDYNIMKQSSSSHNMQDEVDVIEDFFVSFHEKHKNLTHYNFSLCTDNEIDKDVMTAWTNNLLNRILDLGYLRHVKVLTMQCYLERGNDFSRYITNSSQLKLFPKLVQNCPHVGVYYFDAIYYIAYKSKADCEVKSCCDLFFKISESNFPFQMMRDYVINSLPHPLTGLLVRGDLHPERKEEKEFMQKLFYTHEHTLKSIKIKSSDTNIIQDGMEIFKAAYLD
jgi:hypothetical protein